MHWLAVAIGGALGAMARYGVSTHLFPAYAGRFPLGTFTVNLLGSFLMGVCFILIVDRGLLSAEWRSVITAGFLGAFTTFSTFALEAFNLWQQGHGSLAVTYTLISVICCLMAVAAGTQLTLRIL